jgi:ornithine carbamoyltransferase
MKFPKDILTIPQLSRKEIDRVLFEAFKFKEYKGAPKARDQVLEGKSIALIFEKNSLRTRVAFEAAVSYLGGHPIFLAGDNILYRAKSDTSRESIGDITQNLDRLAHGIAARVNSHKSLTDIAGYSKNPVINLLCDEHHPTQALADLMTIQWHKGKTFGLKVAFIGDGNNVATSLMDICAIMGMNFSISSPAGYEIPEKFRDIAKDIAKQTGSKLEFATDPKKAASLADVIYTDTFVSMGDETESKKRVSDFKGYQVNTEIMRCAKSDAIFMHCLPAHRGDEVAAEVIDSKQSVVFDQAECRLHIAKALLYLLYK